MKNKIGYLLLMLGVLFTVGACKSTPNYDAYVEAYNFNIPSEVTSNLFLPNQIIADDDFLDVAWSSSHPEIINMAGTFNAPSLEIGDTEVTLTATIRKDTYQKVLIFVVMAKSVATTHTVTFDPAGGTSVLSQVITHGQTLVLPDAPTKEHYVFDGWYTSYAFDTIWDFSSAVTSSMTLYAKWIEQFTITFEDSVGGVFDTQVVSSGDKATLPGTQPEKSFYTFDHWLKEGVTFDFNEAITADLRLVPAYRPVEFNITYVIPSGATLSEDGDDKYSVEQAPTLKTAMLTGMNFMGWFDQSEGGNLVDLPLGSHGDITLYAQFEDENTLPTGTLIYTKEDLLTVINDGATSDVYLMNDIDMTGVILTGSPKTFGYTFDGRGYTIKNAIINASGNKMGFLFKEVLSTGIIKNVTFSDSTHFGGGTSESSAFISAFAQGGARFEHITFYNVSVKHAGSYAGLIFGDVINEVSGETIYIRNITVINDDNNWIEGSSYVGGLIGSARKPVTIDIENVYFDSKVIAPNQAVGAIMGRLNSAGITLNVRQTVIKGDIESAKNVGSVLGTNVSGSTLIADHIYISDITQKSGTNTVKIGAGNQPSGSINTVTNLYYQSETSTFLVAALEVSILDGTGLSFPQLTETWFNESGFSQTFFKYGQTTIVKNSDTQGEVVETGFTISSANVKKYYMVGEALDLTGLLIYKTYSDGSSILLEAGYTVDTTEFSDTQAGTYSIYVTYNNDIKSFEVNVIEITGVLAEPLFMKQTYLVGDTINYSNLVLKAILSDGTHLILNESDYTKDLTAVNMAIAGEYQIGFIYKSFSPVYVDIYVTDLSVITAGMVEINVNQSVTSIDGDGEDRPTFKTMKSALQYLVNQNYASELEKVIYISDGTYDEKITITVPNLTLVGQSRTNTILTYDAASGLKQPNGSTWGTQGSASVSVKSSATNFMATNLTIQNHFDYNGSTILDKQGVALVNEADQVIFYQVDFKGYQDTLYAKSGRQYYLDVYIEGVVDYIFGNGGPAFFEQAIIKNLARSTGVISTNKGYNTSSSALVTYGYVFYQNEFIFEVGVPSGSVDLGRPWDQSAAIAYIDNKFDTHITTRGWTEMSGNLPENARFYEYQNKDLFGLMIPKTTIGKPITEQEALNYTNKAIVFGQLNGAVDFGSAWDYSSDLIMLQGHLN